MKYFFTSPWKTEFAVKFSPVLNIFFTIQAFWATCACPESRVCPELTVLNILHFFIIQDFWTTCACPEIFHCIEIFFIIQDFWATCACPENSCFEIFHCIEYIFFIIQDFWATCAWPENRVWPEIFQCWNIFYHSRFLSNFPLPWRQSLHWIYCIEYIFFINQVVEQLSLALKTEFALNLLYWIYIFYHSRNIFRIFEQLALAL